MIRNHYPSEWLTAVLPDSANLSKLRNETSEFMAIFGLILTHLVRIANVKGKLDINVTLVNCVYFILGKERKI